MSSGVEETAEAAVSTRTGLLHESFFYIAEEMDRIARPKKTKLNPPRTGRTLRHGPSLVPQDMDRMVATMYLIEGDGNPAITRFPASAKPTEAG